LSAAPTPKDPDISLSGQYDFGMKEREEEDQME